MERKRMMVAYKTIIATDRISHKLENDVMLFCCDKMKEAWDDGYAGFEDVFKNIKERVHEPRVCIYHSKHYPEGCDTDEMPISCCPFCGKPIEMVEVKRVRKIAKVTQRVVNDVSYEEVDE